MQIILNCFLIFLAALIVTRIAGLRTFAKMSSIDFASTIAIGSIIASTILNSNTSILDGMVALSAIIFLQVGTARLIKRFGWFKEIATNKPILLMRHGKILTENLNKSGVSETDLMAKIREANALDLANVKAVVFETTGDIAVLHGDTEGDLDMRILQGVEGFEEY